MPLRNLFIVLMTALVCIVCRVEAGRSRYSAAISEAIDTISREYVEDVDPRDLFEAGIHGMLDGLDPYSAYMPPAENEQFNAEMDQEFGGIGVEIGMKDDRLTVLSPLPGTPAFRAGLLAGDTILMIAGQSTEGFGMEDCVKLIKGEPGTKVELTILHKGQTDPINVFVERAIISVESVRGDRRKPNGEWIFTLREESDIGYLRLSTFAKNSADEIEAAIKLLDGSVAGLIVDLRQNPGGLLDVGIRVCDLFLDRGQTIVSIRGRGGYLQAKYDARIKPVCDPNLPVVLVVDKYSASASEIFSACMQDHGRATIVGQRTYGKGTVQNVILMERGKSAMRLTTATYWRPSEKNIHRHKNDSESDEWGVAPKPEDVIEMEDAEYVEMWRQKFQRDTNETEATESDPVVVDPFIDRAIEIIREAAQQDVEENGSSDRVAA